MPTPAIQRRWKNLPGEPVGDAGDPYTGYDRFGRTVAMRWIKPHTVGSGFDSLVNVQWGYNRASQKTWRKDLLAPSATKQDQHFGYDGLYQVTGRQRGVLNVDNTGVDGTPAQAENFGYDETGNWITYQQNNEGVLDIDQSRVNNPSNQMTEVDGSAAGISYDANGNMLTVPTGEGLTGPSRKLVWDAWNRLRKVSDADDNVIAQYQYDGKTRRTKVEGGGITKHCYYDDQWRTVEERLDASTTPVTQHVWHPTDRWELLFRDRSTANDGTLDERLYSLKDQLDPVAICDTSGSVVERYEYTAFGMPTILDSDFIPQSSSSHDWSFLFHAEFTDAETGWFNYGYRYYVPTLGRWLSRDPIGIEGGINLFTFVSNDPIGYFDIVGTQCFKTRDDAALAATRAGLDKTLASEKGATGHQPEYCGRICKKECVEHKSKVCFYYTGPVRGVFTKEEFEAMRAGWKGKKGNPGRNVLGGCSADAHPETKCKDGDDYVAHWHSHPYWSGGGPSDGDKEVAKIMKRDEYVGVPHPGGIAGRWNKEDKMSHYDPVTGKTIVHIYPSK